jgi:hypothetical protein
MWRYILQRHDTTKNPQGFDSCGFWVGMGFPEMSIWWRWRESNTPPPHFLKKVSFLIKSLRRNGFSSVAILRRKMAVAPPLPSASQAFPAA